MLLNYNKSVIVNLTQLKEMMHSKSIMIIYFNTPTNINKKYNLNSYIFNGTINDHYCRKNYLKV